MGRYGEISRAAARLPRDVREHELAALDPARLVAQLAVVVLRAPLDLDLVARAGGGHAQLDVLQRLQSFQIDAIIEDLRMIYPSQKDKMDWVSELTEKTDVNAADVAGFPHIAETVIKPMTRGAALIRQISIAITHSYDAFG